MKKIISLIILLFIINIEAKSQSTDSTNKINRLDTINAYQVYQLNDNDKLVDDFYYDDDYGYKERNHRQNRFAKTLLYTGVLVGGIALAEVANKHDYFINNTMIYGVGGVLTILSTGLVISSMNGINKQIYFER
jgi:hypothetical protein